MRIPSVSVSLFKGGAADVYPVRLSCEWEKLVHMFQSNGHIVLNGIGPDPLSQKMAKVGCPCFSPATFNGTRSDAHAEAVHLAVVDLDHLSREHIRSAFANIEAQGIEYLAYSGFSHSPDNLSLRVIMPMSRPVPAIDWQHGVWPKLNALVGGLADGKCSEASRAYFLPSTVRERQGHAFIRHVQGRALSVEHDLGAISIETVAEVGQRSLLPVSKDELHILANKLKREKPAISIALSKVLMGEAWAFTGFRDQMLYDLAREIGREYPKGDPQSIAAHFEAACSHYGNEFPPSLVAKKIERRQAEIRLEQEKKLEGATQARKALIKTALGDDREHPYTEAEAEGMAAKLGVSRTDMGKRWLLQRAGGIYTMVSGAYIGPFPAIDGTPAAHAYLSPATSLGVRLEELTVTGELVKRPIQQLVLDYGTVVRNVVADLTAQETRYDARTDTVIEACCPRRSIEPRFVKEVDTWLRVMSGADYPILEKWISWVTDLDRPCAALFLEGAPGTGKSLLAIGLARIWTTGTISSMAQLFDKYIEAIAKCPIVFADEEMPKDWRGGNQTGKLRESIQATQRPYTRKYIPDGTLKGAVRCIIAANNYHNILGGEGHLTPHDIEAITSRIIHIRVQSEARELLAAYRREHITYEWVTQDVIAAHALWLVENVIKDKSPSRFLVEQAGGALHRAMTTATPLSSAIAHWLVGFLSRPDLLRNGKAQGDPAWLVQVRSGRLYVNPQALVNNWDKYRTNTDSKLWTAKNISMGVRSLSDTSHDQRISLAVPGFGTRQKFFRIRNEDLIEWAENTGTSSKEEIIANLEKLEPNLADYMPGSSAN